MGFLDYFSVPVHVQTKPVLEVEAQANPHVMSSTGQMSNLVGVGESATRDQAMTVPAIARARNVICGTGANLHLDLWAEKSGAEMAKPAWFRNPDITLPYSTLMQWTIEDLFFYGVAYWQVVNVAAEDQRPNSFRRIPANMVGYELTPDKLRVAYYYLKQSNNGRFKLPDSGVGSLVTFTGGDEGFLNRAGRTIQTAIAIERAAYNAATEPTPQIVLKNQGMDLPKSQVRELLDEWKKGRRERSASYVGANIDAQKLSFSPEELGLNKSREIMAAEIARAANLPAYILGADSGNSMTYTNTDATRRDMLDYSLRSIYSIVEQRLSMDDITPRGAVVRFSYDDFLRSNPLERVEVTTKLLAAGIIDIDEAREFEDLAPRGNTNAGN